MPGLDPARFTDTSLLPDRREGAAGPAARCRRCPGPLRHRRPPGPRRHGRFRQPAPERRPGLLLRQSAHQSDQRLRPAEHLRVLLLRPDAEGRRELHPDAGRGVSRGGAGPGHAHDANSTSSGGLHPKLRLSYYTDMIRGLKERHPEVHIKALTAVEIAHLARIEKISEREVLQAMKEAGLTSLPGGGAEVFSTAVRATIAERKLTGEEWIRVHRTAHELGIPTNCTMLYGHVETADDRIEHLSMLRDLQDETHGFLTYIPLAYHPDHNELGHELGRVGTATTGYEDLKNIAVGRLFLDNIPHVKTHWPMVTPFLSQVALSFGCDDIEGTVVYERVYHEAGAQTEMHCRTGRWWTDPGRGKRPVERNSLYQPVREEFDDLPPDARRSSRRGPCPWCTPHETGPDSLDQLLPGLRRDRPGAGADAGRTGERDRRRAERPAGGGRAGRERGLGGGVRPQRRAVPPAARSGDHLATARSTASCCSPGGRWPNWTAGRSSGPPPPGPRFCCWSCSAGTAGGSVPGMPPRGRRRRTCPPWRGCPMRRCWSSATRPCCSARRASIHTGSISVPPGRSGPACRSSSRSGRRAGTRTLGRFK